MNIYDDLLKAHTHTGPPTLGHSTWRASCCWMTWASALSESERLQISDRTVTGMTGVVLSLSLNQTINYFTFYCISLCLSIVSVTCVMNSNLVCLLCVVYFIYKWNVNGFLAISFNFISILRHTHTTPSFLSVSWVPVPRLWCQQSKTHAQTFCCPR